MTVIEINPKMKILLLLPAFLLMTLFQGLSQQKNPHYNSELAKKLGADEIGMRIYVIAFLKSGPVKITDSLKRAELQKAHLQNITRMSAAGKLLMAGPFLDNQPMRGIYIFDVASVDEARELTATDPAVKAGTLIMELHPWYGSAALKELPELHKQVQKKGF